MGTTPFPVNLKKGNKKSSLKFIQTASLKLMKLKENFGIPNYVDRKEFLYK